MWSSRRGDRGIKVYHKKQRGRQRDNFRSGQSVPGNFIYVSAIVNTKLSSKEVNEINMQLPGAYRRNCHSSGAYVPPHICIEAFVCIHKILSYNRKMRWAVSILAVQLVKQTTIHQFKKKQNYVVFRAHATQRQIKNNQ